MKIIRILFLFLGGFVSQAQTEKKVDHQSIVWTRYYNQLTLTDKWSLHTEFDNRVFLKPVEQNLFVIRVQGRYKINDKLETGAGFAYFSVSTQDPEASFDFQVPEYRGQQDITWKETFDEIGLNQRLQLEERFVHNASKTGLLPGTTFFWRIRYRLQADYSLWKKENQLLKAIVHDEILFNFGKNIIKNNFDQNRIYAALNYAFNKNIAIELGYLNSFQKRSSGVDFYNRDIIRFSFIHKMKLK